MNDAIDTAKEDIRYTPSECVLGVVLVAASAKGVCALLLGDDQESLIRDLRNRFPLAALLEGEAELQSILYEVVRFLAAPATGLDVPLDIRGDAFQRRVWAALQGIPAGSTASYSDIAQRLGSPALAKDVSDACAANALAVAIPCHRVVRKDGRLSGYRWGVARKRALLAREGVTMTNLVARHRPGAQQSLAGLEASEGCAP
jgi:AraC family transcriptional regulator, regulatory protein of adaptative response / methylated-DNA-[protein]-cysteine methyltransferase